VGGKPNFLIRKVQELLLGTSVDESLSLRSARPVRCLLRPLNLPQPQSIPFELPSLDMAATYTGSCKCGAIKIEIQGEPDILVSIQALPMNVQISLRLAGSLPLSKLSKVDGVHVFDKRGLPQVRIHYCLWGAESVRGQGRQREPCVRQLLRELRLHDVDGNAAAARHGHHQGGHLRRRCA
jgi:hypothetical protein